VTAFPPGSLVSVDTFAGAVTDGGVVSCTVTVPDASTGVESSVVVSHVTVVCPSGKWPVTLKSPLPLAPEGGLQVAASGFPVVGSNAFTLYVASAPSGPVASTVGLETRSGGGAVCAAAGTRAARTTTATTPACRSIATPLLDAICFSPLP
jgi:hypothetical protein